MSFTMHGLGVSGGIAIGHAHLVTLASLEVDHYSIPVEFVAKEIKRFDRAVKLVRAELDELEVGLKTAHKLDTHSGDIAAFVTIHRMLLEDPAISVEPRAMIEREKCNAEWALKLRVDELLAQFADVQDEYLRERKTDVRQVAERIVSALTGQGGAVPEKLRERAEDTILVAHDLSPADVILFKDHQVAAFITDLGGRTSHTAILARSLGIPALVALHTARELVREDELVIVDGTQGVVIVAPEETVLAEYRLKQHQWKLEKQKLGRLKAATTTTLDGVKVELHANIELPSDLDAVRQSGATGVGLFRSEFLFMNRRDLPDEDEQFEAYKAVAEGLKGMPVVIRTLDIGADKSLDPALATGGHSALGLRAIRYCLAEPQLFNTQLRAVLRASRYGDVRILIPMLASWVEIRQALLAIDMAKEQLKVEGKKFNDNILVGGMIEVPAAAIALPMFLAKLDFLSIGTNDLIQYTLAIDRTDDTVAHLYDPLHPAVLHLIAGVIEQANLAKVPVAVCGEMAGDVVLTRLLLGFGLRDFSMHPANLLLVKQRVLMTSVSQIAKLVAAIMRSCDPEQTRELLDQLNAL
ncbi:MAG: phosphoenolpyruvate--protein phosphotransferase [Rhodocyclaceae bacterium]|jgi:phosphotransferase system enzyme I (PtsI)|nr:phosphoenolpyruvate--protein phosphotransferase [Rhodocyclaceae bacterium]MCE2722775.1 phosphoenolpyruvate--protein phosphotransferase [Betaproteobacteria bacterium]MCA3025702.1 phosphoenolpyruvate--protein phosphotransferase [Rhodocyclaceae bacterium]MCA3031115.1 phosphoenolpyruvate--protein phosphotransferase [Rhodocyclaceae bacterium]MCA3038431.1 phosphoenolpyruvate--protein phosphotransferase [Rhodocyclaceae bacterium]